MAQRSGGGSSKPSRRSRPALTPEGRENQLIALAHDLAEQRFLDGTASATEVVHFLKLGSSRERLEQQRLHYENELLKVKREQIESQKDMLELYANAIGAMRTYSGQESPEELEMDEYEP